MDDEEVKNVYVVDVEATPSRSEAGVSPAGTTPSQAASADAFAVEINWSGALERPGRVAAEGGVRLHAVALRAPAWVRLWRIIQKK
eukprot:2491621-Pleurochrysis_carterae.AAC.6